ncbi:hypothetical protein PACTADRAFT_35732 [Pachysolen tannophilus NRRL Y-2460]|uniref:Mediator of RNA polymerase II transcription subunit 11 n=1 Tax=Pachysolen tannophilus NRRL Y-2460 TaxID=669874 RepID=A0A1E4TQF1_PACTA|nr:hypothetical protein PACTADRAFT_35732 [Pachysolen tannophilus NRRL Y-2460]
MSTSQQKNLKYVEERLESLHEIDTKIVSLLDNLSNAILELKKGKELNSETLTRENDDVKTQFKENVCKFYSNLSDSSIGLRKEVKLLDNKISNNNGNGSSRIGSIGTGAKQEDNKDGLGDDGDEVTILPININKKAVWMGEWKLNQEVAILRELLQTAVPKDQNNVAVKEEDVDSDIAME